MQRAANVVPCLSSLEIQGNGSSDRASTSSTDLLKRLHGTKLVATELKPEIPRAINVAYTCFTVCISLFFSFVNF